MVSNRLNYILSFTIVALFGATIFFRLQFDDRKQDPRYFLPPPPSGLKHYAFGFQDSMADSLWIRYIQDIEKCQMLGRETDGKSPCSKGWGYQMLEQITELAPKFRMPYAVGPLSLSIIVDDYDGASLLFEKAIKAFPADWPILYRAGYHYLYDKQDYKRSAELMLEAHKHGGPHWLPMLAARLYSKEGQIDVGLLTLADYLEGVRDEKLRKTIKRRIAVLQCQKDQITNKRAPAELAKCDAETAQ